MEYKIIERVGNPFHKIKPIQWLVDGHIERGSMCLMFGAPASGKSFIATSLACAIATGTPWYGHRVMPTGVLYIAGEGLQGILRRFAAYASLYDLNLEDAPLYRSLQALRIGSVGSGLGVIKAMTDVLERHHRLPGFIVIDTLARNFDAGDENSTKDMSAFIREIDETFCKGLKASVLIVHHTGHTPGRPRGSSALHAAVDFSFEVKKEGAWITLENVKAKETEEAPVKQFEIKTVDLGVYDPSEEDIELANRLGFPLPEPEPVTAGALSLMDNPMVLIAGYSEEGFKIYCYDIVDYVVSEGGWNGIQSFCQRFRCSKKSAVKMLWVCVGHHLIRQDGQAYVVTTVGLALWKEQQFSAVM